MDELEKKNQEIRRTRKHTIVVTVLVMIILFGAGYIVYDKFLKPDEKEKKQPTKVEKKPTKKETYVAKLDETNPYIYIAENYEIPGAYTAGDSIQTAYINIKDNEAITNLNNELKQYSETLKQSADWKTVTTGERELYEYIKSTTTIFLHNDIASMVIVSPTVAQGDGLPLDLKTYTIDLKTGTILSPDDLLNRYGLPTDQFMTIAKSKIEAAGYMNTNETKTETTRGFYMDNDILPSLLYVNENKKLALLFPMLPGFFSNKTEATVELN